MSTANKNEPILEKREEIRLFELEDYCSAGLSQHGFQVFRCVANTSSTMDLAKESMSSLVSNLTEPSFGMALALKQSSPRGRQGRSWSSTTGSLACTYFCHYPDAPQSLIGFSLAFGCIVAEALEERKATVFLKWPNDLVIRELHTDEVKKVGGILIELSEIHQREQGGTTLLIGLGINLLESPNDLPIASSILENAKVEISPVELAVAIGQKLPVLVKLFRSGSGFAAIKSEWEERSVMKGAYIEIDTGNEIISGQCQGVTDVGELIISGNKMTWNLSAGHILKLQWNNKIPN